MFDWIKNKLNREPSLLEYFTTNKLTLPIRNNCTYSHANTSDIETLQHELLDFSIQPYKFKNYIGIYLLTNKTESVIIIDENVISTPSKIFEILLEMVTYKQIKKDNIIQFKNYLSSI
jgi:hypothetical protein